MVVKVYLEITTHVFMISNQGSQGKCEACTRESCFYPSSIAFTNPTKMMNETTNETDHLENTTYEPIPLVNETRTIPDLLFSAADKQFLGEVGGSPRTLTDHDVILGYPSRAPNEATRLYRELREPHAKRQVSDVQLRDLLHRLQGRLEESNDRALPDVCFFKAQDSTSDEFQWSDGSELAVLAGKPTLYVRVNYMAVLQDIRNAKKPSPTPSRKKRRIEDLGEVPPLPFTRECVEAALDDVMAQISRVDVADDESRVLLDEVQTLLGEARRKLESIVAAANPLLPRPVLHRRRSKASSSFPVRGNSW